MNSPEIISPREFSYLWGIIVPGSIVVFSFLVTLWLYRMFAREQGQGEKK